MNQPSNDDHESTLEPPGTIAVIGAGPVGVEAALYGRYLGYDVTLLERDSVGRSVAAHGDQPLAISPDRCLSRLAREALRAQSGEQAKQTLPTRCRPWVEQSLIPLTETDLLRGRLRMPAEVQRIVRIPIELDEDDQAESWEEIPEDFRLFLADGETLDAEAVIVAIGAADTIGWEFPTSTPYFFRVGTSTEADPEQNLDTARQQIVDLYAQLGGRAELDLYRPRRR